MKPLKEYVFEQNVRPIFVETGTSYGGGVGLALACGYIQVFSIEKNPNTFNVALGTFSGDERVSLILKDSPAGLEQVLCLTTEPCTFFLDAHDVERGECPILEELAVIGKFPIKHHTIMIDDWEDFDTAKHGFVSKSAVIDALRKINPEYRIACYYAEIGAPNILVATP